MKIFIFMLSLLGLKRCRAAQKEDRHTEPQLKARLVAITAPCTIKNGVIKPVTVEDTRPFTATEIHRALNNIKKRLVIVANNLPKEWSEFLIDAAANWNGNLWTFMSFVKGYSETHAFYEKPAFEDLEILEIFHGAEEMTAMRDWNWLMGELIDKRITLGDPDFIPGL